MSGVKDVAGSAFLFENPEEHNPRGPFTASGISNLARLASPESYEAARMPVVFVGNYPVVSGDLDTLSWANMCQDPEPNGDGIRSCTVSRF